MKTGCLIVLILSAVAAFAATRYFRPAEVRYRVTIVVDDHGTDRTGSGVWSFRLARGGPVTPYSGTFTGEAFAVDLHGRGTLFALPAGVHADGGIDDNYAPMLPEWLFGDIGRSLRGEPKRHSNRVEDIREISQRVGERRQLDCAAHSPQGLGCPYLIRFTDKSDPASVQTVVVGDLAAPFGAPVTLKSVVVEITGDEITRGLSDRLPWIVSHKGSLRPLRPLTEAAEIAVRERLHTGHLRRGTIK